MPLKSIHIATNGRLYLFFMTDIPARVCVAFRLSIYPPVVA